MIKFYLILFFLITLQIAASGQNSPISFKDISADSGVNVSHISTPDNRYIIESMSGGVAVFDCNGDGFLDIATVNGSSVENFKKGGDLFLTLYRQTSGGKPETPKFENITEASNLKRKGWGMGITAVDFNSDGVLDVFVTGFDGNALYRGMGKCKFEDVTEKSGISGTGFQTGAAWADYDRDGDLDVFVAGYVSIDLNNLPVFGSTPTCSFKGIRVQCGPRGLAGQRDYFYRNRGDGTFEEIADKIGLDDKEKYYGLGATWGDYDDDGWLDLYVANDGRPNYLYRNKADGTFEDVGFQTGTSYSSAGVEQGSMGVAWGDYDLDGKLDLFTTNFDNETNTIYKNLGSKGFLDVSLETNVGQPGKPYVGWGTGLIDFDNDGWLDLFVVNGHVYPQLEFIKTDTTPGFNQPILLQRNLGTGKFDDSSNSSGLRGLPMFSSRGAAFGDLNNDGLIDVIVTNLGEKPLVLLNVSENKNQRVLIKLIQTGKNKDAVGGRLTVRTNKREMMQNVVAGESYLSQNDLRLHFGFGISEKIISADVRWSDGKKESISGIVPNKINTISQGKGVILTVDFASQR